MTERAKQTLRDGPGWGVAAVLCACGIALGSLITRSPIQSRLPAAPGMKLARGAGRPFPVSLPALLPFYAAALALPLFLWLARRVPLARETWRTALPLWITVVIVCSAIPEFVMLALFGRIGPIGAPLFYFLAIRMVNTGPLMLGMAALAHTFEHRRRAHAAALDAATARAELAQAQLKSLTAQLRPHFLFNTLQSVSTLIHRDTQAADTMVGKLGDLLRASLDLGERSFIRLEEELQLVAAYLDIMRERFGSRLDARIESTAHADALVPPFLLQPLVENAMQHGIEPALTSGQVRVSAHSDGAQLVLEVYDSGAGDSGAKPNGGVGLNNTRQRLAALYGDAAALSIESQRGNGTRVVIRIPQTIADAHGAHR